jgi:hypothetical protein
MLKGLFLLIFILPLTLFSQRMLPISTQFRDLSFAPTPAYLQTSPVFPVSERQSEVYLAFRDSSKRYSTFGHFLYQRELIELRDKTTGSKIWITPLLDLSYGAQLNDTNRRVSQNTRGARLEGVLGKRFFFTTSFYENQAFLPGYQAAYASQRGEQFPGTDSAYHTANATIPGAARTKPFKTTGFDYGYATGSVSFFATPKLAFHFGNQPLFVGSGYRSMLWSDNSPAFMNLRIRYSISEKLDLQVMRGRGLNMLRRPLSENAEAWYEKKSVSFTTLYYRPVPEVRIGLFEGGMWSRGDSLYQRRTDALFYVPVPGLASVQQAWNGKAYAIIGADLNVAVCRQILYGQFALSQERSSAVWQIGARVFPTADPQLQIQLEYDHADENAYTSRDPRLHYAAGNLPLAHPAATGFDELLLRATWQRKYWFFALQTNYYARRNESYTLLLPAAQTQANIYGRTLMQLAEAGYRFNRLIGLEAFGSFGYRYDPATDYSNGWISFGIRTQLNNHYFDL